MVIWMGLVICVFGCFERILAMSRVVTRILSLFWPFPHLSSRLYHNYLSDGTVSFRVNTYMEYYSE